MKSTNWTNVINDKNPQTAFDNLFNVINYARDIAFPEKKVKQKAKRFVHSPWITKGLIISHKRKEKLFAKKRRNPSDLNQQNFKQYDMIYNKLRRAAKKIYFDNQFAKFSKNIKQTWSVIKEIIGSNKMKNQIPDIFKENDQIIKEYLEIANGFNNFFSQVGPTLASEIENANTSFEDFLSESNPVNFEFSRISETFILKTCDKLKPKLSSGVDFISNKLLKHIAPIIITSLQYLINLSLESVHIKKLLKLCQFLKKKSKVIVIM